MTSTRVVFQSKTKTFLEDIRNHVTDVLETDVSAPFDFNVLDSTKRVKPQENTLI